MQAIKRGLAPVREATILQVFLHELDYPVDQDGVFGPATEKALKQFQRDHDLIADGVAGEKTWTVLFALQPSLLDRLARKWLSQQQIDDFAACMSLEPAAVRAVYGVEAAGMGFVGLKPKILFEGHVFWKELLRAKIDPALHRKGNEDILFVRWNPKSYRGGLAEHERLERAQKVHATAAVRAASWGLFQILGLHAQGLGFADEQAFVDAMSENEAAQLDAFGRFIAKCRHAGKSLLQHLRERNWAAFAAGYNGPGYATNRYDEKLALAYDKYRAMA